MKKLLFILVVSVFYANAQDTIRFKNGEAKAVKVNEIGIDEIKYNRFDNQTGPLYIVNKSDVASIKYSNGEEDVFNTTESPKQPEVNQPTSNTSINTNDDAKIIISRTKMVYKGKGVGEMKMKRLISECHDAEKQNKMIKSFAQMRDYKKKQYAFGFGGLGVGIACVYGGFIGMVATGYPEYAVLIPVGIAAGITGAIISSVNKSKRKRKLQETAMIFNGDR